ncbi:DUF2190 family protein [Lysobacter yananisis]|uniref:DUF2190 family protein n=1 Tax=Lysobacter yananisis TaxID=1003114 RepID=A0ABY9PAV3_9GAMM|nr:capsid cement protein [Lysobacter yananisis]WMT03311.1 DUF2190 family protein [Lysobacter yananisis]
MTSKISILTLSMKAAVALSAELFVSPTGGLPTAGGNTAGVSVSDAELGDLFPVDVLGTSIVIAGGVIAAGAAVEAAATGRAITRNTGVAVARALDAAAAAGDRIRVVLIPN